MFVFNVWILRGLIAVFLISIVSATIGSFSVFRGSTFFVAGIAHGSLAGASLGIFLTLNYFNINPLIMALIFSLFFALSVGYASHRKENVDVAIGIMFAFSMSLAILFLSLIKEYASVAWGLIIGDILLLSQEDIEILLLSSIAILLLFMIFYRKMLYSIFDPESAEASGIKSAYYETLLFILIAVGVVVLLKCVGAILVYALLVVPAASGKRFTSSATGTIISAFFISLLSGLFGIFSSFYINVAPSALTGLFATFIYFLSIFKS